MNFLMIWSASTIVSVYTVFKQVFKMIKEFAIYPMVILAIVELLTEILNDATRLIYSEASSIVTVIGLLGYAILFTILHVLNRKERLKNFSMDIK